MTKDILKILNERLKSDNIPSRLTEEGNVLTVLLDEAAAGRDIYGDIYYNDYEADNAENGLIVMEWEIMDMTDLEDEDHGMLCMASAIINSLLPAGGYAVRVSDDESSEIILLYRIVIPSGELDDSEGTSDMLYESVNISAAVLKTTVDALYRIAGRDMTIDEFWDNFAR
ncbi:MAG: hypothetical protein K6G03_12685 [Lachnospiraceae bacterium]|nr:hypothetical protein [Lachnospiraceae bacterium]